MISLQANSHLLKIGLAKSVCAPDRCWWQRPMSAGLPEKWYEQMMTTNFHLLPLSSSQYTRRLCRRTLKSSIGANRPSASGRFSRVVEKG
jgi:hypothetical protein